MAVDADDTFWGFLFWVKENPHKSVEEMTWEDLHEMAAAFAVENHTSAGLTVATALTSASEGFGIVNYATNVTFPKYAVATRVSLDGAGVAGAATVALNRAACAQSLYPQQHIT